MHRLLLALLVGAFLLGPAQAQVPPGPTSAFNPVTWTAASISATTTSASVALPQRAAPLATASQLRVRSCRIYNAGTATVFVRFDGTAPTATVTDYPVPSGAIEVVDVGRGAFAAAITASGTATVYFNCGEGM